MACLRISFCQFGTMSICDVQGNLSTSNKNLLRKSKFSKSILNDQWELHSCYGIKLFKLHLKVNVS